MTVHTVMCYTFYRRKLKICDFELLSPKVSSCDGAAANGYRRKLRRLPHLNVRCIGKKLLFA